jgi:hypothetical protein
MSAITDAYNRGLAAGKTAGPTLRKWMEATERWARISYPASAQVDYWDECARLDQERIQCAPNPTRYPETKGLPDLLIAERKGFLDGAGCGPRELAFKYTWFFYCSRRLNTRFVGTGLRANHCTSVYIRDTKEGGPLYGRNLDDIRRPGLEDFPPPPHGPDGKRRMLTDGVSSAVLCDEEPSEMFPVNVWQVMPRDCRTAKDVVAFLQRYNEFWGPQNGIVVDEDQNCVAYEKSNCRMGLRWSDDGAVAVTACSYLIPEMKQFKEERSRLSLKLRGWDETAPDWVYWKGCDARYERLLQLTKEANAKGATLDDMTAIVTDHAVPFPERVCLAGEKGHPDDTLTNWTLTSRAEVLEGPNRRALFWRVEGDTACYDNPPFLVPGEGVEVKPQWTEGTR